MENENAEETARVPLSDILNGVQETAPEPEQPAPEPEVEEKVEEPPKVEEAKEAEGETTTPETPAEPEEVKSEDPWTKTAVIEERRKRQEEVRLRQLAEERIAALEAKVSEPIPDQFEDPEGYQEYQENRIKSVEQSVEDKLFNDKLNLSEFHVSQAVDAEELEKNVTAFHEAAQKNPVLVAEARKHPSPWHYMNEQGKAELERASLGDPATFTAKVQEEAKKAAEAEIAKQVEVRVKAALAEHLPKSLADEQTEGERTAVNTFEGPTPLGDILAGVK